MRYTTSELLAAIKRNQTLVSTTFRFTDSDIYRIAEDCIKDIVVPTIIDLNSDRLLFTEYITLVADTQSYSIPYRAIGGGVSSIHWQDTNNERPTKKVELTLYSANDGELITNTQSGNYYGYFYKNDGELTILPRVPTSGSSLGYLKINYFMNHSNLVSSTATAEISSVDYNTGIVTFTDSLPSTYLVSSEYDFILANRKSFPRILAYDKIPSAVGATTLTFTISDIPTGLVAGDKVCLAEQTDTLLLTGECFKYVCKHVEATVQEAQGDLQKLQITQQQLPLLRRKMETALVPRVKAQPTPMLNNRPLIRLGNKRYNINIPSSE